MVVLDSLVKFFVITFLLALLNIVVPFFAINLIVKFPPPLGNLLSKSLKKKIMQI